MATIYKVDCPNRKPLFEGVQGENEARSIQFDITPWVDELGDGAVTATAKRPQDSQPYPVTVTKVGNIVTWKPTSTDTAYEGVGSFQLEYTVGGVIAKTCIWSTQIAPSLDPAGDPPDPYDNWLADMRAVAAEALQHAQDAEQSAQDAADEVENAQAEVVNAQTEVKNAEAWAVGQRGGVDVPSTDPAYENNAKYWAEQSLANQYGAFIVKSASGEIASFNDGADDVPMKSLNVTITPKQSGSGDPSPDNVRPITGISTANVFVKPLNLFPNTLSVQSFTKNGVTFDITEENGFITDIYMHGTASASTSLAFANADNQYNLPAGSLKMYLGGDRTTSGSRFDLNMRRVGSTQDIVATTGAATITNTEPTQFNSAYIWVYSGAVLNHHIMPCIVKDGVDITGYPKYPIHNGHTTPVPLGQTVYGGELDVVTGVMTIDRAMVDLATLTWSQMSGYIQTSGVASVIKPPATQTTRCDVIAEQYVASTWAGTVTNGIGINGNGIMAISGVTSANGKMVYPLRTPTTVQLTPAEVRTLLGTNNVWSDAGAVSVEYRADPTLAYAELQALIFENM